MRRTKVILLFPLFLVRLILCLGGLLLIWAFMQLLLLGAPTTDPFEPWRESIARGTVRFAGKLMIIVSATRNLLLPTHVREGLGSGHHGARSLDQPAMAHMCRQWRASKGQGLGACGGWRGFTCPCDIQPRLVRS